MPLTVTLEAQQWQSVIAALSEAPYRVAAPLIDAITQQFQVQATQSAAEASGSIGNGVDHNPPINLPDAPPLA
jgi:hypothetical protein